MTDMRDEIIQCLLATQGQSEGVTADAILSLFARTDGEVEPNWKPSNIDYDRSIHTNPDAKAWADFFMATFPNCGADPETMHGWFANAMMALHDHIANTNPTPAAAVPDELNSKVLELCNAVENSEDLSPVKYALKCGRLINEVKALITATPQPVGESESKPITRKEIVTTINLALKESAIPKRVIKCNGVTCEVDGEQEFFRACDVTTLFDSVNDAIDSLFAQPPEGEQ